MRDWLTAFKTFVCDVLIAWAVIFITLWIILMGGALWEAIEKYFS